MPFTASHVAAVLPFLRTPLVPSALVVGSVVPDQHSTRRAVLTYASLVIGAATHIGLDEWTHPNGWGAEHIDWLAARHGPVLGTTWTQLGSSVLGAGCSDPHPTRTPNPSKRGFPCPRFPRRPTVTTATHPRTAPWSTTCSPAGGSGCRPRQGLADWD